MGMAGTPFTLHYQSDRVEGRTSSNTLIIPVTGSDPPASLTHVDVDVVIAGRRFHHTYDPIANTTVQMNWDGRDAYGREVQGAQAAEVTVNYVYPATYQTPGAFSASFGQSGTGASIDADRQRATVSLGQTTNLDLGGFHVREQGLGGWGLDVHHTYDPSTKRLYLGNGEQVSAEASGAFNIQEDVAECVNNGETSISGVYGLGRAGFRPAAAVTDGSSGPRGRLIQTASGTGGGLGMPRPKRSGWAA